MKNGRGILAPFHAQAQLLFTQWLAPEFPLARDNGEIGTSQERFGRIPPLKPSTECIVQHPKSVIMYLLDFLDRIHNKWSIMKPGSWKGAPATSKKRAPEAQGCCQVA